jgi:hypothetical protein
MVDLLSAQSALLAPGSIDPIDAAAQAILDLVEKRRKE